MSRKLDVYLHWRKAGVLEQDNEANLRFTYDEEYLNSEAAKPISVSMPLTGDSYANKIAKPYFTGLLPDESARSRLASVLGVSDTNAFGMLEIIGGECAGALSLLPLNADVPVSNSADTILDQQQLGGILHELRGNPLLGSRREVRLSLAGAQDKIAVKIVDEKVALVKNGEPTTHILKPCIQNLHGTAENEYFCMTLATRVGLTAPEVRFSEAGDTQYILVKRFDRQESSNGVIHRLHQEDFCQALSVSPELKYEDEGGPGVAQSQELVRRVVSQPAADQLRFLRMLIFHYLVGNADAHAKNYALLYSSEVKAPLLAPVYDALCTAVYPSLTKNMAMRIGGRNLPDTIHRNHWLSLVPDTKAAKQLLVKELSDLATNIIPAMEQLLSECKELGIEHPVLNQITKVIRSRSQMILRTV